jgi:hypothetical protein
LLLRHYYVNVYLKLKINMRIQPKSPELIQAQVTAFAKEAVTDVNDRGYLIGHVGTMSHVDRSDVYRIVDDVEYRRDEHGKPGLARAGDQVLVATGSNYVQYLRTHGGSRHDAIGRRASLLTSYAAFEPVVEALVSDVTKLDARDGHRSFKGEGSNSGAFVFEQNGKEYIVRIPHKVGSSDPVHVDNDIDTLARGKGIPHVEQIVAASYEKGRIITEALPGADLSKWDAHEMAATVTNEQLQVLVETIIAVSKRGIGLDTSKASNYLYDRMEGFGLIDYGPTVYDDVADTTAANIEETFTVLAIIGDFQTIFKTPADIARSHHRMTASLQVAASYVEAVRSNRSTIPNSDAILKHLDAQLSSYKQTMEDHNNPTWIDNYFAMQRRIAESKRQLAAIPPEDDFVE